jgi:hypothetical protein
MADDTRLSQDEFEALVNDTKGDCDKCKMDCRDRLRIQSYQIERLEKAIQRFEIVTEALAEIVVQNHPDSFQRKLNELTARILGSTGEGNEADRTIRRLFIE